MNLKNLTRSVEHIAQEAGAFIRQERSNFQRDKVEEKASRDLVSYVDRTSEQQLVESLAPLIPGAGFLTEEETTDQERREYTWIIDPLDGTTNFVHGIPNYCVSIGLLHEGRIICGVVYEITQDECFSAWENGGAYLNGAPITVATQGNLEDCLFATGFPIHNFQYIKAYLESLDEIMRNSHGIRRLGSAAADMAYVACGRYGGYFEYNLNAWDVAAGIILVKEAGGNVADFGGGEDYLFGRQMLCAGKVYPKLLSVLKSKW